MKIGIITFQLAWNCGAVLQCYAMQEYLKSRGHDVVVINYRPDYKKYRYVKYCNPFLTAKKEIEGTKGFKGAAKKYINKFGRTILNFRSDSEHIRQYYGFQSFCQERLNLTQVYTSIEELNQCPPECDVYISGSDQLWNPKLTNNELDSAYFLQFGAKSINRITYAISACEFDPEKNGETLRTLSNQLDHISLREHEGMETIEKLTGKKIEICPDPTFLPDRNVFDILEPKYVVGKQDYILVYLLTDTTNDTSAFDIVKKIKEKTNKEVLVISGPRHWPYEVTQIQGVLPEEFVFYIKNASFVVCNSFHATVFSILYKKQFITLSFKNRNSRMLELLHNLDLTSRMLKDVNDLDELLEDTIDYTAVEKKAQAQHEIGAEYLERCL